MNSPSTNWLDTFVRESNRIDPQPGHANTPGDPHYDDHLEAAKLAISLAKANEVADPQTIHKVLMFHLKGMSRHAGRLRDCNVAVGGRVCPNKQRVPELLALWKAAAHEEILACAAPVDEQEDIVWRLHIEFETVHPFIDGNGRTGRLLMLNHALLLGIDPWVVKFEERYQYYDRFPK